LFFITPLKSGSPDSQQAPLLQLITAAIEMANDRMDTGKFRMAAAAIVVCCFGMLALFLYLNYNETEQPALRGARSAAPAAPAAPVERN
jgi:hypothetical protein